MKRDHSGDVKGFRQMSRSRYRESEATTPIKSSDGG